jgi:mannan polymerase II complex ANP1 subunit
MEQERIAHEKDEEDKRAKEQKIREEFGEASTQWEKDKADLQNLPSSPQQPDGLIDSAATKANAKVAVGQGLAQGQARAMAV